MEPVLVNGNSYDWVSITLALLNNFAVQGVTEIMYDDSQEKKDNYGSGKYPSSRGRGQVKFDASITLEEIEVRRILKAAGVNSLLDVPPFTMVVSYLPDGATVPVIDKIGFCEFTKSGVDYKSGDTTGVRKLPLICAGITWGKAA